MGYEGWRFDFVKGYGPEFVKEYVVDTVGDGTFNVGEYWVDLRCARACWRAMKPAAIMLPVMQRLTCQALEAAKVFTLEPQREAILHLYGLWMGSAPRR